MTNGHHHNHRDNDNDMIMITTISLPLLSWPPVTLSPCQGTPPPTPPSSRFHTVPSQHQARYLARHKPSPVLPVAFLVRRLLTWGLILILIDKVCANKLHGPLGAKQRLTAEKTEPQMSSMLPFHFCFTVFSWNKLSSQPRAGWSSFCLQDKGSFESDQDTL